jgi:hypothetical protein
MTSLKEMVQNCYSYIGLGRTCGLFCSSSQACQWLGALGVYGSEDQFTIERQPCWVTLNKVFIWWIGGSEDALRNIGKFRIGEVSLSLRRTLMSINAYLYHIFISPHCTYK